MTQTPLPEQERKFARIQVRRDNSEQWNAAALPYAKLLDGEIGLETDTGRFKIGDGESGWSALPYWDRNTGKIVIDEEKPDESQYELGQLWFSTVANELRILLDDAVGVKVWSVVSIPISNQGDYGKLSSELESVLERLQKLQDDVMAMGNTWFDGQWEMAFNTLNVGELQLTCEVGNGIPTLYSEATEIKINQTDSDNRNFNFSELKVGTYLRLSDSFGKTIYQITEDRSAGRVKADGTGGGIYGIAHVHSDLDTNIPYPGNGDKFYVQAISAGQKDVSPEDYVLKDPKGESQAIESGAFAIKGDGTHEGSTAEEKSIQTKESVDAAIKAFEDGTLEDKHYAVYDGDNTWTGKNDYKEYPTSDVEQTAEPEKVQGPTDIMNQLVRYQTVVDYLKAHPNGDDALSNYLNKEEGGDVNSRVNISAKDDGFALTVHNTASNTSKNSIFQVSGGNNWSRFRVRNDGTVQAGHKAEYPFIASEPHDVLTKAYTDNCFKYSDFKNGPTSWENGLERAGTCWRQSSSKDTRTIYFSMIKIGGGMFLPPWTDSYTGEDPADSYKVKVPVDIYYKQDPPDWPDSLDPKHGTKSAKQIKPSTKELTDEELEVDSMSQSDQYFNKKYVWPNGLTLYRRTHLVSIVQETYNKGGHTSPNEKKRWYLPVLKLTLDEAPILTTGTEYYFHFGA